MELLCLKTTTDQLCVQLLSMCRHFYLALVRGHQDSPSTLGHKLWLQSLPKRPVWVSLTKLCWQNMQLLFGWCYKTPYAKEGSKSLQHSDGSGDVVCIAGAGRAGSLSPERWDITFHSCIWGSEGDKNLMLWSCSVWVCMIQACFCPASGPLYWGMRRVLNFPRGTLHVEITQIPCS